MKILEILISPFLFIIKQLFLLAYDLTSNYGLSIILLSFSISLLLLPIFILIEKAKKRDDAVKLKMKPRIDEIKRCYKGQERYYYIKTINKEHNYTPFRSLIPILSLLLQIPFFIAAYQFLEGFKPLEGATFLFINDLSLPDALLGRINVLPIIMTLVNLATVYFYTRNNGALLRKQMIVIAGVFLVMLFNLASGLVLYWTMNNVFSFLRLFITNRDVFNKSKKDEFHLSLNHFQFIPTFIKQITRHKTLFVLISILALSSQVLKFYEHRSINIIPRLIIAEIAALIITLIAIRLGLEIKKKYTSLNEEKIYTYLFYGLLFLSIYIYLAAIFYYSGTNPILGLNSIVIIILTQITGLKLFWNHRKFLKKWLFFTSLVFFALILIFQILNLGAAFNISKCIEALSKIRTVIFELELTNFAFSGSLFSTVILVVLFKKPQNKLLLAANKNWPIYVLAIFYITGFIFLWNPLTIYSSFPETFEFPAIAILRNNFLLFAKLFLVLILLYLILPKKLKRVWLIITLALITLSFIHNTIFPINVGPLQENIFVLEENLGVKPLFLFIESFGLIGLLVLFGWLLKKSYSKQIVITLILLNMVLICQAFYESINTGSFTTKKAVTTESLNSKNGDSSEIPHSISFSKNNENIVFLITDMFQGYAIDSMIKEFPQIKNELTGFIWYPNTLSVSTITNASISAIIGGFNFTPQKMNENTQQTIGEKVTIVTENFRDKIKSKGFTYTSTAMIYSKIDINSFDTYLPNWDYHWNSWNYKLNIGVTKELDYTILWENALFYSAPLFLKSRIYNGGIWFNGDNETNENTNQAKTCNFLRLLPYISNTNNSKPSFIYIHTMASHHPWNIIDDNGKMHAGVSPYDNNKWVIQTLIKWIEWMKVNNVYNNTKIIIVSDHGEHWWSYKGDVNIKLPLVQNPLINIDEKLLLAMNPLLLVKDFQSNDSLKLDWRFMSNADATAIAFDENNPTKGPAKANRILKTVQSPFVSEIWNEKLFKIEREYLVKDNFFDMTKWTTILEKK